jgi:DNA polymerase (family 10)
MTKTALTNADVARFFAEIADLLEITGADAFRVNSYRRVARSIGDLPGDVSALAADGQLATVPGVGKSTIAKIEELLTTGNIKLRDELCSEVPETVLELLQIPGIGPKTARALWAAKQIACIDDLEQAIDAGALTGVKGVGPKTIEQIRSGIAFLRTNAGRRRLGVATRIGETLRGVVQNFPGVKRCEYAGSLRRGCETVGDIDLLCVADDGPAVIALFCQLVDEGDILAQGATKGSIRYEYRPRAHIQVDLRVVPAESFGAALQYFTGSKEHNIAVRRIAQEQGLKVSEYGIFRGEEQVAGAEEEEMYSTLGLAWVAPELREDRGEVAAARDGRLPELVTESDLRGDLHSHTNASDGSFTLEQMAAAAQERGYEYLAVTDHSKSLTVANGLDEDRLARQIDEIARLNESFDGFRLLASMEVDILDDGSLDLSEEMLARLDLVTCSIHSGLNKTESQQTERIIRAMDNPYCNIIAHPTGRLLGSRRPYPVNMERLLEAAAERGCFFEINAQPERLDLRDEDVHAAKELGIKIAISTDAHAPANLRFIRYGVDQARRGWLTADDVLNTRSPQELTELLARR